jgi:hypothetical protein
VERAYRKIGLKAEDEAITGDMLAHGVDTLNSMMFGWELFGININHILLAATDDFPLDARFEEGTVYQLASRLSPDFLVPAPDADVFFRALQAAYLVIDEVDIPTALLHVPSKLDNGDGFRTPADDDDAGVVISGG